LNVAIWLVINLLRVIGFLFQTPGNPVESIWMQAVESWFSVPASWDLLMEKPWTIMTYMILHMDFWHLFFNLLWLYWFGKIFLEFMNERKFVLIYILGGISGALLFILAFNFFPVFSQSLGRAVLLGASASVIAIVIATVVMVPNYTIHLLFFGSVKIKYIALAMIILDIFMLRSDNSGGHFAHLGGAIAGLCYVVAERKGMGKILPDFKMKFRRKKVKKVYSSGKPLTDEEYNLIRAQNQKKIDGILDKIAKSGYKSLSEEEKEFLFKFSNK
jgi:membrane associated rhomboid family serine protease